jgi:hypothetical protein
MKKMVLLFALAAFVVCAPLAMAKDLNWNSLLSTWNTEQLAAQKKAAEAEKAAAKAKAEGKVVVAEKKKEKKEKKEKKQ